MMESSDARKRDNASDSGRLDDARNGRIARERHVRSVFVVVAGVLTDQAQKVAFAEHDQMVQQLASQRSDESLGVPILPRRSRSDEQRLRPKPADPLVEALTVNAISLANQTALTSGPVASAICCAAHAAYGCAVTFTCSSRRRSRDSTTKTYSVRKVAVGTVRKSTAIVPAKWSRTNVAHVVDGGRGGRPVVRGMYLATESLLTS